jgi:hypothetical protein
MSTPSLPSECANGLDHRANRLALGEKDKRMP